MTYYRTSKLPISKFSMILTPLKLKTSMKLRKEIFVFLMKYFYPVGMYTSCAFDCFSDIYCIDRTLVCDRYKNCPNGVDEANCEYSKSISI